MIKSMFYRVDRRSLNDSEETPPEIITETKNRTMAEATYNQLISREDAYRYRTRMIDVVEISEVLKSKGE